MILLQNQDDKNITLTNCHFCKLEYLTNKKRPEYEQNITYIELIPK